MKYIIDDYINSPLPNKSYLLNYFDTDDELVIFDIGACEAGDTIRYANLFPNSCIYSFEPIPNNYKIATSNIERYKLQDRAMLFNMALSNQNGSFDFHVSSGQPEVKKREGWDYGNKSSSLLKPTTIQSENYPWLKYEDVIQVETQTLKTFCENHKIQAIDFIHIDVQGAEKMVFEGAEELLQQVKMIWMEVEKVELYEQQPLQKEIQAFMRENGFVKKGQNMNRISGDQLYVNVALWPEELTNKRFNKFIKWFRSK